MTTITVTKKIKPRKPRFIGTLDSDEITRTGDVMRVFVSACPGMKDGEKLKVTVKILELDRYYNEEGKVIDEGSDDDMLASFEGYLHRKGHAFFFSEMRRTRELNWSEAAPYPWFRVTFARETDKITNTSDNDTDAPTFPVVIGKNDEPQESPQFEIGYLITTDDGTALGHTHNFVSYLHGEYSYAPFLAMYDIRTQLDSINLLNVTSAQIKYAPVESDDDEELTRGVVADITGRYETTVAAYNDKKMKTVEAALKQIDKLIKTSRNPWFQHIREVNEYYEKLEAYKNEIKAFQKLQKTVFCSPGDCFHMETGYLQDLALKLNALEENINTYLKTTAKPPEAYMERIDKNIAIIKRNKQIEKLLDDPVVQVLGILPGAGVVTGALKLLQGNYTDGFLDVFGSLVTYGSFMKLARVGRAFKKSSKPTLDMLYSNRYREMVSRITKAEVMEKMTGTAFKQSSAFLGNLFETVGTFKSLRGHVDSIALLHRNRKYIVDMTEKAIRGIQGGAITDSITYLEFLKGLGNVEAGAEFFAHIRLLHAMVKGGKDAYSVTLDAMDDINKLFGYGQLPGINEFDKKVTDNIAKFFILMRNTRNFDINYIIREETSVFTSTSAIMERFNEALTEYDMFGLKINADVRYRNTRAELLLAIDEILDIWRAQCSDRKAWIKENEARYLNKSEQHLKKVWAIETKFAGKDLPESLEVRVRNFSQKTRAFIEMCEGLRKYNTSLSGLDTAVHWSEGNLTYRNGVFTSEEFASGPVIFDIETEAFAENARRLVERYTR